MKKNRYYSPVIIPPNSFLCGAVVIYPLSRFFGNKEENAIGKEARNLFMRIRKGRNWTKRFKGKWVYF